MASPSDPTAAPSELVSGNPDDGTTNAPPLKPLSPVLMQALLVESGDQRQPPPDDGYGHGEYHDEG
jgi:hypothetical protein